MGEDLPIGRPPGTEQTPTALAALDALISGFRLPAGEWPGSLAGLDGPGLYAWFVDPPGAAELSRGLGLSLAEGLIYVGQAGAASSQAGIPSAATLRSRIGSNHLGGRVRSSTLRRTLAAILMAPLSLVLIGPRRLDAASEERLTAWMRAHLSLAVYGAQSGAGLAQLEEEVVARLQPPLNVEHMSPGPLRRRLQGLRRIVLAGIDDLWTPPDQALTEWRVILGEYGQAFDGYRYAKLVRRRECADVADEVWRRREAEGRFASSFADLRCALFWLQRYVRNDEQTPGWEPAEDLPGRVADLYEAIQDAWDAEHGSSRDRELRSITPEGAAGTPPPGSRPAGLPTGPIAPFDLACASYLYEAMTGYASSLDELRRRIGLENAMDPSLEEHRLALLGFLNDWGCRGLATDWHALASTRLERWYCGARERLASLGSLSWPADACSRRDLAEVFDELSVSIAAHKMRKGRELLVSYGPTATAKTLFILRPDVFPAWDGPIRSALSYRGDGASYAQFTADVHAKIAESAEHYGEGRPLLESLPEALGRPAYTTLTQLVADYYWITITRGVKLRGREEISRWLSW